MVKKLNKPKKARLTQKLNQTKNRLRPVKKRPLRIGFDLDGVILYNPARIVRPLIDLLKQKKCLVKRERLEFFVPKTKFQQFMWWAFHLSSFMPAPGLKELKKMIDQGEVEAYLITGRFAHLQADTDRWLKRLKADQLFKQVLTNRADEQPHLFKARVIKNLKLDVFVEDNWDIVSYLQRNLKQNPTSRIFWVANFFDQRKDYPHKFFSLRTALQAIQQLNKKFKT